MLPRLVFAAALVGLAIMPDAFMQDARGQSQQAAPANLATVHVQSAKLACNACHGDKTPTSANAEDALATADRSCTNCHGDAKAVAAALLPKLVHKEINPHASHLVEIDCVTCHRGHAAAEAYCQQCHAFDMAMPPKATK